MLFRVLLCLWASLLVQPIPLNGNMYGMMNGRTWNGKSMKFSKHFSNRITLKLAKFGVRSIYHFLGIKNFPNRGQK